MKRPRIVILAVEPAAVKAEVVKGPRHQKLHPLAAIALPLRRNDDASPLDLAVRVRQPRHQKGADGFPGVASFHDKILPIRRRHVLFPFFARILRHEGRVLRRAVYRRHVVDIRQRSFPQPQPRPFFNDRHFFAPFLILNRIILTDGEENPAACRFFVKSAI